MCRPETLPEWRALRKGLDVFPSPTWPADYWIVATAGDVLEFTDLDRRRANYLRDEQARGRLTFDPLGRKSSRIHFNDEHEHKEFREWLAARIVANRSRNPGHSSK